MVSGAQQVLEAVEEVGTRWVRRWVRRRVKRREACNRM